MKHVTWFVGFRGSLLTCVWRINWNRGSRGSFISLFMVLATTRMCDGKGGEKWIGWR